MQILIATEGAAHSDTAVRLGTQVAVETGSHVTLLTVISDATQRPAGDALLNRTTDFMKMPEEDVSLLVRVGQPSAEIIREAESGAYDLVVVGERPTNRILKRLFTQTAERVIQRMPCPILLARGGGPLRRFLVCEGGQDPELLAVLTGRLAPLLRSASTVEVLHVMSQMTAAPGVRGWELRADAEEHMERHTPEGELLEHDLALLEQLDIELQVKMRHGLVVDEILDEARRGEFDIIVLGAHQVSGWRRLLAADPVHEIALRSELPLLIV